MASEKEGKTHVFMDSYKVGEHASHTIRRYLQEGKGAELFRSRAIGEDWIESVEDNPDYRKIDVDYLLHLNDGQHPLKLEIKGDASPFKNIYFEWWSNQERQKKGWIHITEADVVIYYFMREGLAYVLPWKDTYRWFLRHYADVPSWKKKKHFNASGKNTYTTCGFGIPRDAVYRGLLNEPARYSKPYLWTDLPKI